MKLPQFERRRVLGRLVVPVVTALALGLTACASTPSPEQEREVLLQRAKVFWKAMLENDVAVAWTHEELSKNQGGPCRPMPSVKAWSTKMCRCRTFDPLKATAPW